jgi:ATP-dependent protease Clp ATPase subunit
MKISVPGEEIEKIMQDYNCSEKDAAKAYLDARERSHEAFKSSLESTFGPQPSKAVDSRPPIRSPREIKRRLDKYIIGQEEYKKRLAMQLPTALP